MLTHQSSNHFIKSNRHRSHSNHSYRTDHYHRYRHRHHHHHHHLTITTVTTSNVNQPPLHNRCYHSNQHPARHHLLHTIPTRLSPLGASISASIHQSRRKTAKKIISSDHVCKEL